MSNHPFDGVVFGIRMAVACRYLGGLIYHDPPGTLIQTTTICRSSAMQVQGICTSAESESPCVESRCRCNERYDVQGGQVEAGSDRDERKQASRSE